MSKKRECFIVRIPFSKELKAQSLVRWRDAKLASRAGRSSERYSANADSTPADRAKPGARTQTGPPARDAKAWGTYSI